jgi:hypothetical protein
MERSEKLGLFIGDQMVLIPRVYESPDYNEVRTEIWFEVSGTWDCQDDPQNGGHLTGEVGVFPNPVSAQRALDEWKQEEYVPCAECKGGSNDRMGTIPYPEIPTIKELVVVFAAPAPK